MRALVKADDLQLAFGPTQVLRGAGFLIHRGDKIALVGPNGAGKTTLFRILAGQQRIDLGSLDMDPDMKVRYLPQVPDIPAATPVQDLLVAPTATVMRLEREIADLEAWMAEPSAWEQADSNDKMGRYTDLQDRLARERSQAKATRSPMLNDLGVPEEALETTWGKLSGGERSKVLLAKAMNAVSETDLVLLDEPTNHMDIQTVEVIEEYMRSLPCTMLVSAHDKYLLDNVATRVFEVDHRRVFSYEGNYTSYRLQRQALARIVEARRRKHHLEVERQLRIIEELKVRNKFDAQVRSRKTRMKLIEEVEEVAPTHRKAFRLLFGNATPPRDSLRVDNISKRFGDRTLFAGATFEIEGGDKVGVVGPNGCGKSTLIRILAGLVPPDTGKVVRAPGVQIGYFDQHHETLQSDRTLIEEARSLRDPPPPDEWTRGLLGRFHFSGDAVFHRVKDLSGGERARLALAKFIVGNHNTLILDEPTNHLDLESQDVVASAISEYEGTVLAVSHNRSFLDDTTDKTLVIAHRRAHIFTGSYSEASQTPQFREFVKSGVKGRYKVLGAFRDWEGDRRWHAGDTLEVTGLESQAFKRLLRWAEGEGKLEQVS